MKLRKEVIMNKFKQSLQRFMYGRYGVDQFGQFIFGVAFVVIILNMFFNSVIFYYGSLLLIIYGYYRAMSKNHSKRYSENMKFLGIKNQLLGKINREKRMFNEKKVNHIYSCPSCKQKIRVPKGKGKIEITCPKCHTKFVKRS